MPDQTTISNYPLGGTVIKSVSTSFDANVESFLEASEESLGQSSGIPDEVMKSKARLLAGIGEVFAFVLGSPQVDWLVDRLQQDNAQLQMENYRLRQQIQSIEERLASLETAFPKERMVLLRDLSKEQAEQEIRRLFESGETLYYSDIAEKLRLPLDLVVEICQEMQETGDIEIDASIL